MARRIQISTICFVAFLLVLPLVYSEDSENKEMDEIGERLLKLLQAKKARRTELNVQRDDGLDVTTESNTKSDNGIEVSVQDEGNGTHRYDIKNETEETERIVQACQSKLEILIVKKKDEDVAGTCFVHKMGEKQYQSDCNGTGEKYERNFTTGSEILDKTFLSKIEGAEICVEIPTFQLVQASEIKQEVDENDKRIAVSKKFWGWGKCYTSCYWYPSCSYVCMIYSTWWWTSGSCLRYTLQCSYYYYCYNYCG